MSLTDNMCGALMDREREIEERGNIRRTKSRKYSNAERFVAISENCRRKMDQYKGLCNMKAAEM